MVVLFVAETWVLTEEISQKIKGVHVVFLRKLTGKDTRRLGYNSRRKLAAEAGGGKHASEGGNKTSKYLHLKEEGYSSRLGGLMAYFRGMPEGDRLRGG